ncbi:hypothetical protein [Phyllobacterium zundukense]|uniref:DUF883 domain-containing protein n=1 Tax=Phyllobacterium zundukense TaxID=1867719 RepID=A0A2N9W322_9HYPH|nr:hypothetical protein [Phyllobacterium zundukense]ATU94296.1 hypothetical protein BLM14_21325 [Phyllobacterium zundukense]PIO46140.1 hypothetical protein B5P45_03825 [Phyllobacterium zundukense]
MATYPTEAREKLEDDLEAQIATLSKELSTIKKSLADQGYDFLDQASSAYESVKRSGRTAARFVGDEAQMVTDKAKDNPIATIAIISAIAGIGLLVGLSLLRR